MRRQERAFGGECGGGGGAGHHVHPLPFGAPGRCSPRRRRVRRRQFAEPPWARAEQSRCPVLRVAEGGRRVDQPGFGGRVHCHPGVQRRAGRLAAKAQDQVGTQRRGRRHVAQHQVGAVDHRPRQACAGPQARGRVGDHRPAERLGQTVGGRRQVRFVGIGAEQQHAPLDPLEFPGKAFRARVHGREIVQASRRDAGRRTRLDARRQQWLTKRQVQVHGSRRRSGCRAGGAPGERGGIGVLAVALRRAGRLLEPAQESRKQRALLHRLRRSPGPQFGWAVGREHDERNA